jgi:hypothetical protein
MSRRQLPPQIKKITLADKSIRYQLTVDVGADPDSGNGGRSGGALRRRKTPRTC